MCEYIDICCDGGHIHGGRRRALAAESLPTNRPNPWLLALRATGGGRIHGVSAALMRKSKATIEQIYGCDGEIHSKCLDSSVSRYVLLLIPIFLCSI
jgi:hypothetical protein